MWRVAACYGAWKAAAAAKKNKVDGQCAFPEGVSGFEGALNESNIACACERVRLVLFPQIPRRRKGMAVAAARSLARRGILDSGSQRKSWADKKKVSRTQTAREQSAGRIAGLQRAAAVKLALWRPVTR